MVTDTISIWMANVFGNDGERERERESNSGEGEGETRGEYGGTRPAAREMQKARATKRLAAREKMACGTRENALQQKRREGGAGRKDTTKWKRTTKQRK